MSPGEIGHHDPKALYLGNFGLQFSKNCVLLMDASNLLLLEAFPQHPQIAIVTKLYLKDLSSESSYIYQM